MVVLHPVNIASIQNEYFYVAYPGTLVVCLFYLKRQASRVVKIRCEMSVIKE